MNFVYKQQHAVCEILKNILIVYILHIMTHFTFCCHFD